MEDTNKVRHALAEAARKRAESWLPVPVRKLPDVETLGEIAMLGAHSFALVQSRRRLLKDRIKIEDGAEETPSALARDYLRLIYKTGPKGTKNQLARVEGIEPVPSYAKPGHFYHGLYVDIKACYWSIMNIVGWNVDYNPGLWLSDGRPPADFPFSDHHVARDCLASAGRLGGIPMYDPRRLPGDPYSVVQRGNALKNNQLPRLIADVLNSIADACIKAGAVYVNNDGMIAPSPDVADKCRTIISDWGLTTSIKGEGPGEVKASGTYAIGTKRTLNYNQMKNSLPIHNVYPPEYARWLQREFSFFAAKRG